MNNCYTTNQINNFLEKEYLFEKEKDNMYSSFESFSDNLLEDKEKMSEFLYYLFNKTNIKMDELLYKYYVENIYNKEG